MALAPRNFPLTREQVYGWLQEYDGKWEPTKKMRAYLESRVAELELEDEYVDTTSHADLDDRTHIVDMVLMDLGSYGNR
jgi:hypothetical protein